MNKVIHQCRLIAQRNNTVGLRNPMHIFVDKSHNTTIKHFETIPSDVKPVEIYSYSLCDFPLILAPLPIHYHSHDPAIIHQAIESHPLKDCLNHVLHNNSCGSVSLDSVCQSHQSVFSSIQVMVSSNSLEKAQTFEEDGNFEDFNGRKIHHKYKDQTCNANFVFYYSSL